MMCLSRATHQVVVHLEQHTTNKQTLQVRASLHRPLVPHGHSKRTEKGKAHVRSSRSLPLSIGKQFVIATPTCHRPAHTPRGPVGSVLPQVHLATLREAEWRTVVHLERSDHRRQVMDDSSGVGQLRSISWMSGSLKPCTQHLALALYPVQEITISRCFSLITSACVESMMVTALKIGHSLPFGFDCFRKLRLLFCRKVVPRYLVGVP